MNTQAVAAIYVHTNGTYFGLDGVDPWDVTRDARKYDGPYPVVAHPPCNVWCMIAPVNAKRWGRKVGDDGGCFEHALKQVRKCGGVLEHPAETYAWPAHGLVRPSRHGWTRDLTDGSWSCEVAQRAYGHPARKLTWLLYVGSNPPPPLDWSRPPALAVVSNLSAGYTDLPRISKKAAAATPELFRDALIAMARNSKAVNQ